MTVKMTFAGLFTSCLGYVPNMDQRGLPSSLPHKRKRSSRNSKHNVRKLVISAPTNFRHTTHMGIGGLSTVAPQEMTHGYESIPNNPHDDLSFSPPLYPCKRMSLRPSLGSSSIDLPASHMTYKVPQQPLNLY
ncbi:hypothetical protein H4R33_002232 [Dimargaris cristalligena]|uniref:CRIB domain-containing protein n=1 Tax=Dimargaris cristalligena TaxID=215637 RepID=A0A4Q0A314_9FUNG|nr:hypothetical protein H4R33_002232 [Dimargaris cristalligena]RKP39772.1 hypothetical protein BJ085DRAFT_27813 [Dimargaris cristalligena]|eukprot:RKP39772.1 hypothetical protein BJ085DRAFT_27813 [Dimargaris cristalligena]